MDVQFVAGVGRAVGVDRLLDGRRQPFCTASLRFRVLYIPATPRLMPML
jgi:hypothetical protein